MKNKNKIFIYLLSGFIPLAIFFICASINGFLPIGKILLNIYDSYTQYSGILLEYKNLLLKGNIFYSWNGGLGFNFFGTMLYYCTSPLNLFSLLATPKNYPYFIAYMTYLRIFLLGLSMCFYLTKRGTKPLYTILFSTIYALMGYTAAYYYNFIWIDSVIMFPLVMHGLDRLIDGKSPLFYIVALSFTIIINYYIGYMICIFIVIYFLYRLVTIKKKKSIIRLFVISSLLSGLIGSISIIPSFFALSTGKAKLYASSTYSGISRNATTFFYTLTSGEFFYGDQSYGPAQVYTSILCTVLTIFYFFNKSFSKKEKIATFIVLLIFYLSFSVNVINYAWHFFQRPIWWQSRFSFVFSFFLIITSLKTLENIDKTSFKFKYRIIILIGLVIAILVGLYFKLQVQSNKEIYTYLFLGLSIILLIEEMLLVDKKNALILILLFTTLDLSINTFNSLKQNNRGTSVIFYSGLKENYPTVLNALNKKEDGKFFRMEMVNDYLSNDGLYFNYHGINYFNSVRNMNVITFLENLDIHTTDHCHVILNRYDPVFLSLFNIKYLYGKIEYFNDVGNNVYENPYPLSLGIVGSRKAKDIEIKDLDYKGNLNRIISGILGRDANLYKEINRDEFILKEVIDDSDYYKLPSVTTQASISYTFTADDHYLVMPNDIYTSVYVNGKDVDFKNSYIEVYKGDEVNVTFRIYGKTKKEDIFINLLYMDRYKRVMEELSKELMTSYTYKNGHILEGYVTVSNDDSYLFTTIEHENGMKVYVDGKEVEYDVIANTFIGFSVNSGEHTITIDYIPKGLKAGAIMCSIGIISSVIYLQMRKKHL